MRVALLLAILVCPAAEARQVTLSHYRARHSAVMSNGKRYTDSRTIFASRQYPLGTRLRVTLNGRSVVGVVEDRPSRRYAHRLDVNEAARRRLRFSGLARARVEVLKDRHPP